MSYREGNKNQIIETLSEKVATAILELQEGDEASIAQLVDTWYRSQGYECRHIDINHGYVWTKDGGATFAIEVSDLIDVLDRVTKMLNGQRLLDFSEYNDMFVGLPYNLQFTVRKVN